jgi:hypothetical protein
MIEPTPELPDDTLISGVEFPARIRTVLAIAGLETVDEVRETSDEILLSLQDFGKASVTHLRETLGLPSRPLGQRVASSCRSARGNCFSGCRLNYGANARRLPCAFRHIGTKTALDTSIWSATTGQLTW